MTSALDIHRHGSQVSFPSTAIRSITPPRATLALCRNVSSSRLMQAISYLFLLLLSLNVGATPNTILMSLPGDGSDELSAITI